jgi:hypothetical protein
VQLSPTQAAFLRSEEELLLYCGGVGSGKTTVGSFWAYEQARMHPERRGFIGANTYKQLSLTTLLRFLYHCRSMRMSYVYGRRSPWYEDDITDHDGVLSLINGAQIFCYSLDNYNVIRGIEVAWAWIDETRDSREEAFKVILERLRGHGDIRYCVRLTSTPDGYNWMYHKFAGPEAMEGAQLLTSTSYDNPFNPRGYASKLEERLGYRLAQQQIHAKFVNLQVGQAYAFKRSLHTAENVKHDPDLPLHYSMDFNVAPLCGVIFQVNGNHVYVLDEIRIPDSGLTKEACAEMARRWASRNDTVIWYGDQTAGKRDTRGGESDLVIMKQVLSAAFPNCQDGNQYGRTRVVDRVNAVNALLEPAQGAPRITIDQDRCRYLIQDLEQVRWKPGTKEIDKDSKRDITHLSDALGYPLEQLFPVRGGPVPTEWAQSYYGGAPHRVEEEADEGALVREYFAC